MSYQSNPNRPVEESYASSGAALLPGSGSGNINVGASNSARGEGTTTSEICAKLRFLNSGVCLFIILFHTLPIALNPVRLTLMVTSPIKLILELIVSPLAVFLFCVEARIPVLGEKVLRVMQKFAVGGNQFIDLDLAGGRVTALMIMGASLGLINHLAMPAKSSGVSPTESFDEPDPSTNTTEIGNDDASTNNGNASASVLFTIIQCTVFSPTTLMVFTLAAYTLYVMHTFPEYASSREYSIQDGSESTATAPASDGPSWISNVGTSLGSNGYQTVTVNV